jgi:hypothetical protein
VRHYYCYVCNKRPRLCGSARDMSKLSTTEQLGSGVISLNLMRKRRCPKTLPSAGPSRRDAVPVENCLTSSIEPLWLSTAQGFPMPFSGA